jgi:hypothetical protein
MTPKLELIWAFVAVMGLAPLAYADAAQDIDDATITVVAEGDTPDDVVNVIDLPANAAPTGPQKSAADKETAKSAKANGNDFGQQVAEDARSNNRSDQVREDAKEQGRSEARGDNASDKRRGPPQ